MKIGLQLILRFLVTVAAEVFKVGIGSADYLKRKFLQSGVAVQAPAQPNTPPQSSSSSPSSSSSLSTSSSSGTLSADTSMRSLRSSTNSNALKSASRSLFSASSSSGIKLIFLIKKYLLFTLFLNEKQETMNKQAAVVHHKLTKNFPLRRLRCYVQLKAEWPYSLRKTLHS